ncbi:hypothetical protein FEE95_00865 [Maribacter algarum]|uniref:Uncharacterized protein n=1 Tax=Maribacter algarum (ex Zhang et al. 2020) TaxID=2578118 RepID=A0A5S3PSP3_9FLAO|nr:hypothetical protein [Maribacter algarum]TMM58009.1 hypothetical protein FEE95_00865 [Maribacter algarum]
MAQRIEQDRYPKFVADQVLTERSLNQMFGYLEEQQRLTRTTLIGIGILCGMKVSLNSDGTELTISHGVGVTSKGYLVPFPETTYSFYDDTFSPEQEIFYDPFLDDDNKQKFDLHLLHNNDAAEVQISLTPDFLKDMVVVIFVELLKVDNKNCDPDSCDDKGCTIEVTHRPLLVHKDDIHNLIFGDAENPFLNEPSCIEWQELKMPKYNVPSTIQFSSATILQNFLNILSKEFIDEIETVLSSAYTSFGYCISEEFPSNPFSGLASSVSFLFGAGAGISKEQLNHAQYYYDFFSDLILAYEELRELCNACLSICCPNEELFPRHLILGYAISSEEEFRHHWIKSPALSCGSCSEERIKFLLKKIALLIQKRNIPRNIPITLGQRESVKITPSTYGNIPLSNKAIPYYYDIVNSPNELYVNWNHKRKQLKKGETNLSYDVVDYGLSSYYKTPLDYDLEPHNFLRIEGHIGLNWQEALDQINKVINEKRLPIEVLALNADILRSANNVLENEKGLTIDEVIEKESFAYYALNNPGIQHKAGVTTGGTFILVYNDKPEVQGNGSEFAIVADSMEEFKMMEIERTDNPNMLTLMEAMKFRSFEEEKLKELVDQFEAGTVIADFFVPYISKAIVQSVPPPTPPEITFAKLPTLNLRWGKDRRPYSSLIKNEANIDINSTQPEEKKINGTVNLMQVNLLGENDEWLNSKPILHLFKYKPKKRNSEVTNKSGFRKEAPNSLSFYKRVNEFSVDRKNMILDIKQDRYFSVKGFKNEIRAMGLRSAFHNVYFYLALSVEVNGETIFGKPSKIFKITINENNHFSFHIS